MESFPDMTINGTKVFRATGIGDPGRVSGAGTRRPDPEVPERARRRTFTAKCKLEVLAAYDAAPDGEKGAVLRREGLYSSHIVDWRRGLRRRYRALNTTLQPDPCGHSGGCGGGAPVGRPSAVMIVGQRDCRGSFYWCFR